MAGLQEILTLFVIAAAIFLLPRFFPGNRRRPKPIQKQNLSWGFRTGIVLSILVPLLAALVLKPWEGRVITFVCAGIIPVFMGWAAFWIWTGYQKSRQR
ncbi:MAG: hypothetical protein V1793_24835 [Pseudomonadota bacterium]